MTFMVIPRGKPVPERIGKANGAKSKVRAHVDFIFARQKEQLGRFVGTIGIKRSEANILLTCPADGMHHRFILERWTSMGLLRLHTGKAVENCEMEAHKHGLVPSLVP